MLRVDELELDAKDDGVAFIDVVVLKAEFDEDGLEKPEVVGEITAVLELETAEDELKLLVVALIVRKEPTLFMVTVLANELDDALLALPTLNDVDKLALFAITLLDSVDVIATEEELDEAAEVNNVKERLVDEALDENCEVAGDTDNELESTLLDVFEEFRDVEDELVVEPDIAVDDKEVFDTTDELVSGVT